MHWEAGAFLLYRRHMKMNIIYRELISVEDYNKLREAVGWGKLCDEQAQEWICGFKLLKTFNMN